MTKLLTLAEAAEELGIDHGQLRRAVRRGEIAYIRIGQGMSRITYRFTPEDLETFRRMPRTEEATVYVVGFGRYVKIGFTTNLVSRVRDLEDNLPEPLRLYAKFDGSPEMERTLHKRFTAQRSRGEWFILRGALKEWINGGCWL